MDGFYSKEINDLVPWINGVPKYKEGHEIMRDFIRERIGSNASNIILDIGSGNGSTIVGISEGIRGALFYALDFPGTHNIRSEIKKILNIHEIGSSIEDAMLGERSYSGVTAAFALHHVGSPGRQDVYDKIFKSITPGGVFCMFDVQEIDKEVEKAFLEYYIANSGLSPEAAKNRYTSLVGSEFLEMGTAKNEVKDGYEDKHLRLEEYIAHIETAGFIIEKTVLWKDGGIENKKPFIILANKPKE